MKSKTAALIRMTAILSLMGGAACWRVSAADVQENWDKNCTACHGKEGKGDTKMGQKLGLKDYTDPKVQDSFTDDQAFKAIKEGMKEDGKMKMKAFGDKFTDEEIKALVAHVRSLKKG
jgi:mono/diheme cytochrome c family protein